MQDVAEMGGYGVGLGFARAAQHFAVLCMRPVSQMDKGTLRKHAQHCYSE
jgi:hypothetical protein